jgi:hypothetical protein
MAVRVARGRNISARTREYAGRDLINLRLSYHSGAPFRSFELPRPSPSRPTDTMPGLPRSERWSPPSLYGVVKPHLATLAVSHSTCSIPGPPCRILMRVDCGSFPISFTHYSLLVDRRPRKRQSLPPPRRNTNLHTSDENAGQVTYEADEP